MLPRHREKRHRTVTMGSLFTSFQTETKDSLSPGAPRRRTTLITEVESSEPALLRTTLRAKSLHPQPVGENRLKELPRERNEPGQERGGAFLCRLPALPPSRLGPGSYNTQPSMRITHSIFFEKAPRFPMTYREKLANYRPSARELSPSERKELAQRIQENIQALKRYTPLERLKTVKEQAALEQSRSQVTRTLHQELKQAKRQRFEEEIEAKQRRFEWRMRPAEISQGKWIWSGLMCALTLMSKWDQRYLVRKKLHKRSQKVLKFLLLMAISVGKICSLLRKKRRNRAFAVLRKILPFLSRWRQGVRQKMLEKVTISLENCTALDTIYRLIATWKRKIVGIQRHIRQWLMRRRLHKQLIVKQWEAREMPSQTVKNHKAAGYVIKEIRSDIVVPEAVKYLLAGDLLKEKVKFHLSRLQGWKSLCQDMKSEHRLRQEDDPLAQLPELKLPPAPLFTLNLTDSEMRELQQTAEKKRLRWDRMAKEGKQGRGKGLLSV